MTWAPSAAKRLAMAAPKPREAPLMSAIRPWSRPLATVMRSRSLRQERQLDRDRAGLVVGEGDRIIAGEAGVAVLGRRGVAPSLAHRAVEPVDRDEGETVGADKAAHRP